MSGPKAGSGRVVREGETARRFSSSLPGPLPPFLTPHTAILEPDFRNKVFPNPVGDGDLSSSFRCRLYELGPLVGQNSSLGMHPLVHAVPFYYRGAPFRSVVRSAVRGLRADTLLSAHHGRGEQLARTCRSDWVRTHFRNIVGAGDGATLGIVTIPLVLQHTQPSVA